MFKLYNMAWGYRYCFYIIFYIENTMIMLLPFVPICKNIGLFQLKFTITSCFYNTMVSQKMSK